MKKEYAKFLLNKTTDDYNRMAPKFSSTRRVLSNDMLDFINYVKAEDKILDLGCGNGRLVDLFKEIDVLYTGADTSKELLKIAQSKYPKRGFVLTDPLKLPFDSNSFDLVFNLAVLHHLPSIETRLKYLKEIRRVLKKEGKLILSVWNLEPKYSKIKLLAERIKNPRFDFGDLLIPFKDKDQIISNRYLHCFGKEELKKLILKSKFEIIDSYTKQRNKENENLIFICKKNEG